MSLLCMIVSYIWGVPSMISNFLVFIFILWNTPKNMKVGGDERKLLDGIVGWNCWMELLDGIVGWNCWMELLEKTYYKFFLLHTVVYNFQMSFCFSAMLEPEVLFPALGAKINGLGWWFGYWGYDVGPFLFGYILDCGCQILASLDLCITYRYAALLHGVEYWKTWLFYLHLIGVYIVSWSISWALQQAHVPLEKFLEKAKQDGTYDAILPYIQNDRNAQIFGYSLEKVEWIFGVAGVVIFGICYLVIKNSLLLWRLLSQFRKLNLSCTTARLHRRLTVLVAMQITYPFVAFSGPVIVFTVSVLMRWDWIYGSKIFHWVVESLFCSLPLFNGVTTLYFVAPYKEALMRLLIERQKLFRVSVISSIDEKSLESRPSSERYQRKSSTNLS